MRLSNLLDSVKTKNIYGSADIEISGLTFDSRKVGKGDVFFAIKGTQVDGHQYIEQTIKSGVSAIVLEDLPEKLVETVCYIQVEDVSIAMGIMASNFYDNPSQKLKLVGITGTNGKTSVATLLFKLFRNLGYSCGLISTVQNQIDDTIIPSTHTTPDAIQLNNLLSQMVDNGCTYTFMEVSSHAIAMNRISGLHFTGAVFTNITQDHLDYHGTFEEYIKVKKRFFDELPKDAFALSNTDDRNGKVMLQNTKAKKEVYTLRGLGTFKGKLIESGLFGLQMEVQNKEVWFQLIGKFNAYNLLAVYGTAILLGEDSDEILTELSKLTAPPGRFELVKNNSNKIGIVDYAHTPDAVQNVLETINDLKEDNQEVITVIGCGGNRDKGKRPKMAEIACNYSNKVIFTSDNPRNEDPNEIINDMLQGVKLTQKKKTLVIVNREEAIKTAVMLAKDGDIILVAGKGHETYQEINGVKNYFDDKKVLSQFLNEN